MKAKRAACGAWLAAAVAAVVVADETAGRGAGSPTRPGLRVVSYNIRHGTGMTGSLDLARTAAVLRRLEPDLVALQEVDEKCRRSGGVDQAAELGAALGMQHRFGAFMDHDGGRYGLAVLSRWPITSARRHELPRGAEPRSALAAEVDVPGLDPPLSFICVHLDWTKEAFRVAQTKALIAALGAEERPAIIAGDSNGAPGSEALDLLAAAGWRLVAKEGRAETWPADVPTRDIDQIFARGLPAHTVAAAVVDEPEASDHRPVLAVFTFDAAAGGARGAAAARAKIGFDLAGLDASGLAGPPGGKVAVGYEFRIPDTPEHRAAVRAIDPTIAVTAGSRGRVNAGPGFALCIGSTHGPRHREILLALAGLPFVERIERCHFE